MSNLHRIKWIDERIRKNSYPNCKAIADEFEISTRQALRDIEYLKYSLDAPVEFSAEKNGYYYADELYAIPSAYISAEEQNTLSYLAYRYRKLGSENELKIASLFDKLAGSKKPADIKKNIKEIYGFKSSQINNYEPIKDAIQKRIKINIRYVNAKEEASERIIHPYSLFIKNNNDYLEAFCELKKEIRIFRLDKIRISKVAEEKFEIPKAYKPAYIDDNENFEFRSPFTCRLKLKGQHDRIAKHEKVKNLGDNIYEISYSNSDELIKFLLSLECNFTIVHPAWLKSKLVSILDGILKENL